MTIRELLARAANLREREPSLRQLGEALGDLYEELAKFRRHVRRQHVLDHPSMTAQKMQERILAVEDEEIE
jgi:hypothetical protein